MFLIIDNKNNIYNRKSVLYSLYLTVYEKVVNRLDHLDFYVQYMFLPNLYTHNIPLFSFSTSLKHRKLQKP